MRFLAFAATLGIAVCLPALSAVQKIPDKRLLDSVGSASKVSIAGEWTGVCHGDEPSSRLILKLDQSGKTIYGTCVIDGISGTCKRYLRGSYDSQEDAYICKDIGLGMDSPADAYQQGLIDKYEFHLVEMERKL